MPLFSFVRRVRCSPGVWGAFTATARSMPDPVPTKYKDPPTRLAGFGKNRGVLVIRSSPLTINGFQYNFYADKANKNNCEWIDISFPPSPSALRVNGSHLYFPTCMIRSLSLFPINLWFRFDVSVLVRFVKPRDILWVSFLPEWSGGRVMFFIFLYSKSDSQNRLLTADRCRGANTFCLLRYSSDQVCSLPLVNLGGSFYRMKTPRQKKDCRRHFYERAAC